MTRDHSTQRVYRQRTRDSGTPAGMASSTSRQPNWLPPPTCSAAGTGAAFHTAGAELAPGAASTHSCCGSSTSDRRATPDPRVLDLRQSVLHRPVERNQLLNPFKFAYYAGLADLGSGTSRLDLRTLAPL